MKTFRLICSAVSLSMAVLGCGVGAEAPDDMISSSSAEAIQQAVSSCDGGICACSRPLGALCTSSTQCCQGKCYSGRCSFFQ